MFAKPPPVPRAESLWLSSDSTNITTESMPEPAANSRCISPDRRQLLRALGDVYATGAFAVMCVALLVIVGAVLRRMRGARAKVRVGLVRAPSR